MWTLLKFRLAAFRDDTDGTGAVEAALLLPLLLWAYAASFVFFDGFHEKTLAQKAAYTISDIFARQSDPVNDEMINGAKELYDYLAQSDGTTSIRVSSVLWNRNKDKYVVKWSKERGDYFSTLRTADLVSVKNKLPTMFHRDTVLLVETHSVYEPMLNVGWGNLSIDTFVFSRPRFVPRVLFQN